MTDSAGRSGIDLAGRIEEHWSAVVALLAGVTGVAGSYVTVGFSPAYVVAPVETGLSKAMPGFVLAFAITVLGDLGQQLNLAAATALSAVVLSLVALVALAAGERAERRSPVAPLGGVLAWGFATFATGAPVASLGAGGGVALALGVAEVASAVPVGPPATVEGRERRRFLGALASLVGVGSVAGLVASQRLEAARAEDTAAGSDLSAGDGPLDPEEVDRVRSLLAEADEKSLPNVGEMEPLVSEDFYEVDISSVDPSLSAEDWTLSATGDVANEVTFDYDDLKEMETEHRFVTLRCVGESLNGHKTDTALWTGTSPEPILDAAEPQGEYVVLRAADGYYEEFPLAALREGLLAYGMNGKRLPRGHGYPVRALVPGHWGEINVKWLTEIEVSDEPVTGYWEERGWHGTGPVNTVAKIHHKSRDGDRIRVGGHAYAGTRGVSTVEVSTDGGDTWQEATLSEPLPGDDVWRQWVYEYDSPGERHEVVARAIEPDGTVQPEDRTDAYPSGAAGWVSKTLDG